MIKSKMNLAEVRHQLSDLAYRLEILHELYTPRSLQVGIYIEDAMALKEASNIIQKCEAQDKYLKRLSEIKAPIYNSAMDIWQCPVCGRRIRKNYTFCHRCGTRLNKDAADVKDSSEFTPRRIRHG